MLGADDVGHRVVVRHRTPFGATDVLGQLVAAGPQQLVVRTEGGAEHRIPLDAVIAARRVGPRPRRYSEILALEQVADRAWPAPVVERVGQWLLRYADGWTSRANSALPLGAPWGEGDPSLAEAVQECRRFYTDRGVTPRIMVPLPVRRDVARHLAAAGWVAQPPVLVQTATLAPASAGTGPAVELLARPSAGWLALVSARKAGLPAAAQHVLMGAAAVRFAQARDEQGAVVASARGAVVDQPAVVDGRAVAGPVAGAGTRRWLHIGLVEVVPAARRQGLARAVTAALVEWAAGLGATHAVLQVEQGNTPAIRLYESLGFTTHHTYVTYYEP